jgi:hypothetical protein
LGRPLYVEPEAVAFVPNPENPREALPVEVPAALSDPVEDPEAAAAAAMA